MFSTERFNKLLQDNGVTYYRLAKELGCSQSSVKNWASNRNAPSFSYISKISDIFNVPIDYLTNVTDEYGLTYDGRKLMGQLFKGARIGAGKDMHEISKQTGIATPVMEYFEVGDKLPAPNELLALCATIGTDPFKLFGEYAHMLFPGKKNKPTDNGELSQKDIQLVNWFRSLPKETRQAILTLGAAPKGLDD